MVPRPPDPPQLDSNQRPSASNLTERKDRFPAVSGSLEVIPASVRGPCPLTILSLVTPELPPPGIFCDSAKTTASMRQNREVSICSDAVADVRRAGEFRKSKLQRGRRLMCTASPGFSDGQARTTGRPNITTFQPQPHREPAANRAPCLPSVWSSEGNHLPRDVQDLSQSRFVLPRTRFACSKRNWEYDGKVGTTSRPRAPRGVDTGDKQPTVKGVVLFKLIWLAPSETNAPCYPGGLIVCE
jgi:hypothetical protein